MFLQQRISGEMVTYTLTNGTAVHTIKNSLVKTLNVTLNVVFIDVKPHI